jgi:hypothetical protein
MADLPATIKGLHLLVVELVPELPIKRDGRAVVVTNEHGDTLRIERHGNAWRFEKRMPSAPKVPAYTERGQLPDEDALAHELGLMAGLDYETIGTACAEPARYLRERAAMQGEDAEIIGKAEVWREHDAARARRRKGDDDDA